MKAFAYPSKNGLICALCALQEAPKGYKALYFSTTYPVIVPGKGKCPLCGNFYEEANIEEIIELLEGKKE